MMDPTPPGQTSHGWRTPCEDECHETLKNSYVNSIGHVLNLVTGYLHGDLSYFEYEIFEIVNGKQRILARIWSDEVAVRHLTFGPRGAIVSDITLHILTCQDDVVRAHPDAVNAAMRC